MKSLNGFNKVVSLLVDISLKLKTGNAAHLLYILQYRRGAVLFRLHKYMYKEKTTGKINVLKLRGRKGRSKLQISVPVHGFYFITERVIAGHGEYPF